MSRNVLTELSELIADKPARTKIIEVISHDGLNKELKYKSASGVGTLVSEKRFSPGDSVLMDGDNVVGLAEPVTNIVWIN